MIWEAPVYMWENCITRLLCSIPPAGIAYRVAIGPPPGANGWQNTIDTAMIGESMSIAEATRTMQTEDT